MIPKKKRLTATSVTIHINRLYVEDKQSSLSFALLGLNAPLSTPRLHRWLVNNDYCSVVISPINVKRYQLTSKGLEANLGTNGYKYLQFSPEAPQLIYSLLCKDNFF